MPDKAMQAEKMGDAMQQTRVMQRFSAVLVLVLAGLLAACAKPAPEQAVRAQLGALQVAIDTRDAGALEDLLAADFIGNAGMDRRAARQLAAGLFLRYRDVGAKLGPIEVSVHGATDATARFTLLATGGSGGLLPEQGQVFAVETGWRLIGGEWRLRSAGWKARL